jgi:hypothetical protein
MLTLSRTPTIGGSGTVTHGCFFYLYPLLDNDLIITIDPLFQGKGGMKRSQRFLMKNVKERGYRQARAQRTT